MKKKIKSYLGDKITVGQVKRDLNRFLNELNNYDDDELCNIHPYTDDLSDPFIAYYSLGYISLYDVVSYDDDDYEEDE